MVCTHIHGSLYASGPPPNDFCEYSGEVEVKGTKIPNTYDIKCAAIENMTAYTPYTIDFCKCELLNIPCKRTHVEL